MSRLYLSLLGLVLGISTLAVVDVVRTRHQANDLAASRDQLQASLSAARTQLDALTSKVDALTAVTIQQHITPAPDPSPAETHPVRRAAAARPAAPATPKVDPRWKQMEARVAANQDQIAKTRDQLAKTQDDLQKTSDELQGKLNTARDELSGSIAKTHEEVVALQRRGERNYHEFEILRSKQFEHVGPLSLSLRKADVKHGRFDMAMIVDDATLEKKNVNLYEPVWIRLADRPQPLELVVNRIDKDRISGYVSEPKYKNSEISQAPTPAQPQPTLKQR